MSSFQQNKEYYDYVFGVVRNLIEYREYKNNIQGALESIKQNFPAVSYKDNETAFKNVFEVYLKTVDLLKKKENKIKEYRDANKLDVLIESELNTYKKIDLPPETLKSILGYIFYYKFQS